MSTNWTNEVKTSTHSPSQSSPSPSSSSSFSTYTVRISSLTTSPEARISSTNAFFTNIQTISTSNNEPLQTTTNIYTEKITSVSNTSKEPKTDPWTSVEIRSTKTIDPSTRADLSTMSPNGIKITRFDPISNPVLFQTEFTLSSLSLETYVSILNSNYDVSDCIVNCTSHGRCKYGGGNAFICVCEPNYVGPTCHVNILPCSHTPCLNNATCFDYSTLGSLPTLANLTTVDSYYCECGKLYYGTNCENKVDVCLNETCSGNGRCQNVNDMPTCNCFSLFSGNHCEIVSDRQKTVKSVSSTTSTVAIALMASFVLLVVLSDFVKLVNRVLKKSSKSKFETRIPKRKLTKKYIYVN